jgi:hypothetical protein
MAYLRHKKSLILRKTYTNLREIIQRSKQLFSGIGDYNGADRVWTFPDGKIIEFGYLHHLDDRENYRGREHDFLGIDEATEIPGGAETVEYLQAWVRSPDPQQLCQTVLTFNPPTSREAWWVVDWFGSWWVEQQYEDGQLIYTIAGQQYDRPDLVEVAGMVLSPRSTTFIRAGLSDNPALDTPEYRAKLYNLPEPLRSQLLYGRVVNLEDDEFQIIPNEWVELAQQRWQPSSHPISALGVDVARGGKNLTTICPIHCDGTVGQLNRAPGKSTPTGAEVVQMIQPYLADEPLVAVDVVGVGSSPLDALTQLDIPCLPLNGGEASTATECSGKIGFSNKRAELWWAVREALDPESPNPISLPPDPMLAADLTVARWSLSGWRIQVESKLDIKKRLGRSPDSGDALTYALAGLAVPRFVPPPGKPRRRRLIADW